MNALIGLLMLAGFAWPLIFIFVVEKRARAWFIKRYECRIYMSRNSGRELGWKTTAEGRVRWIVTLAYPALLLGPMFLYMAIVVGLTIALRAMGIFT